MNKTKIEWCDFTSNPIRGKCLHSCPYCYAERIRKRFKKPAEMSWHPEELTAIQKRKKPSVIFVGSTYDVFGSWVPEEWITIILNAIKKCSQHTFLFLTKNPGRYHDFDFPENSWQGITIDGKREIPSDFPINHHTFISYEPLLGEIASVPVGLSGIIVGAHTDRGPCSKT